MSVFSVAWHSFTAPQRRNIGIYILGIMFYKLGLEFFNGSITSLATDRFTSADTFSKLGAAQGLNQAMQCVGAILIAPLAARFSTRAVLSVAVVMFALMTTILLITDAATGGEIRKPGGKVLYGDWDPNAIFPIWAIAGIAYGMVELIRRVIPADICGGDVMRLRRMDATVHILYEVAGTAGAFSSTSAILRFGNNYSFLLTPIFFTLAGITWWFITPTPRQSHSEDAALSGVEKRQSGNYFKEMLWGGYLFFKSVYVGAVLIFTNRKFVWLFTSYSVALYLHRALESMLAPAFAKRILGVSAWSQIMVGGSNFGELLGALFVFLFSTAVPTPMPWLRLDALMLNLVWLMPYYSTIATKDVKWAWIIAVTNLPISFGWAAGDVSLAAYIQSSLNQMQINEPGISPLGAVMAFLYSAYIVLNAVLSSLLGKVFDNEWKAEKSIYDALSHTGGVMFSVGCGIIFLSTFIPRGSWAFNPKPEGDLYTAEDANVLDGPELYHGAGAHQDSGKTSHDDIDIEKQKHTAVSPVV